MTKDAEVELDRPSLSKYRNVYHKLLSEYLEYFNEDPRRTNFLPMLSNLASEYIVVPVYVSSLGLPRWVKEEAVAQVSNSLVQVILYLWQYASDLLYSKARAFFYERTVNYDSRYGAYRTQQNYAELDFRDFCNKLLSFCQTLLFEPPFEGKVTFSEIIDLLKTFANPLQVIDSYL